MVKISKKCISGIFQKKKKKKNQKKKISELLRGLAPKFF